MSLNGNLNVKNMNNNGIKPIISPPVSILTNSSKQATNGASIYSSNTDPSRATNSNPSSNSSSREDLAGSMKTMQPPAKNNIYSKTVRQSSENSLYGAKVDSATKTAPEIDSPGSLKVFTEANSKGSPASVDNLSAGSASDLKTPVSAVQFHIDEAPLKRLPHQHRGSLSARTMTQQSSILSNRSISPINSNDNIETPGLDSTIAKFSNTGLQTSTNHKLSSILSNASSNSGTTGHTGSSSNLVEVLSTRLSNSSLPSRNNSIKGRTPINGPSPNSSHSGSRKSSLVPMPGDFLVIDSTTVEDASSQFDKTPLPVTPPTEKQLTKKSISEYFPKEEDNKLHILIGATGSVATVKIPMIINKLLKHYGPDKCSIQLILTNSSINFLKGLRVCPLVKVWTDEDLDSNINFKFGEPILQMELRKWADIFLIAPLSANTLAKVSNGISDNLLTTVIRGWPISSTPLYVAPAMNTFMYIHPITKKHLALLHEDLPSIVILKPVEKVLVCGDIGMGGMREWNDIVKIIIDKLDEMKQETSGELEEEDEEDDDDEEEEDEEEENNRSLHKKNSCGDNNDDEVDDDDEEDDDDEYLEEETLDSSQIDISEDEHDNQGNGF